MCKAHHTLGNTVAHFLFDLSCYTYNIVEHCSPKMLQVLHERSKEETAAHNCYKEQCCLVYGGLKTLWSLHDFIEVSCTGFGLLVCQACDWIAVSGRHQVVVLFLCSEHHPLCVCGAKSPLYNKDV